MKISRDYRWDAGKILQKLGSSRTGGSTESTESRAQRELQTLMSPSDWGPSESPAGGEGREPCRIPGAGAEGERWEPTGVKTSSLWIYLSRGTGHTY